MISFTPPANSPGVAHLASWHHTAFRITNPVKSVPFYQNHFGMTLIQEKRCGPVTTFFLARLRQNDSAPTPNTPEAEKFLFEFAGTVLALIHECSTPVDTKMNNGNEEPNRGFGHIAFNCNDVYASSKKLEENGVAFKKRPDEGRMKGLAFALDPDGYWIEIVGRGQSVMPEEFNLSQTMIRVKDPKLSIEFYRDLMGMTVVRQMHMSDFSNYFLAYLPKGQKPPVEADNPDAKHFVHELWNPCLELTHNHGTENDAQFQYHSGNTSPVGFSHLAFLVEDVAAFCQSEQNCEKVNGTTLRDPDGYSVKLFKRAMI